MMSSLSEFPEPVKPTGIFDEIWIRGIVDLVWEAFRLRRLNMARRRMGGICYSSSLSQIVGKRRSRRVHS